MVIVCNTNLTRVDSELTISNISGVEVYYNFDNTNFSISIRINQEWSRTLHFSDQGMWLVMSHNVDGVVTDKTLWTTVK